MKLNVKGTTKDKKHQARYSRRSALVAVENPRAISKDDVARRAYELFPARGGAEGHDVEDWLEAERQLVAESVALQG